MKKGNRNFEEVEDYGSVSDSLGSYCRIDFNLFDIVNNHNLKLQELDLRFSSELQSNGSRFRVIRSNPRVKKMLAVPFWFIMVFSLFYGLSILALQYPKEVISFINNGKLDEFNFSASVSVLVYTLDLFVMFLQLCLIGLLFILVLGFFIKRPFMRIKDGKFMYLILDDVGFFKIDVDLSRNYDNRLEELDFVQFIENENSIDLTGHVKSVSYFSSYCKVSSDRKYYILDLPNDTVTYSNEYDLEFVRKDFNTKDFKYLCNYLDGSEDA